MLALGSVQAQSITVHLPQISFSWGGVTMFYLGVFELVASKGL